MRGLVTDAVADAALEASYVIFERPAIEREAERTSKRLEAWLAAAAAEPTAPPEEVLRHLIDAPRAVFDRVGDWIGDADARRRAIALAAHLRRLYAPAPVASHASQLQDAEHLYRLELSAGRVVLGAACAPGELAVTAPAALRGRRGRARPPRVAGGLRPRAVRAPRGRRRPRGPRRGGARGGRRRHPGGAASPSTS